MVSRFIRRQDTSEIQNAYMFAFMMEISSTQHRMYYKRGLYALLLMSASEHHCFCRTKILYRNFSKGYTYSIRTLLCLFCTHVKYNKTLHASRFLGKLRWILMCVCDDRAHRKCIERTQFAHLKKYSFFFSILFTFTCSYYVYIYDAVGPTRTNACVFFAVLFFGNVYVRRL